MQAKSIGGFTLLELLVVISIMAFVIGITAARFSGSSQSVKLKAETRQLIAHFRYTRVRALSESRIFAVTVIDEGRGYQVDPGAEIILLPPPIVMSLHSLSQGPEFSSEGISFYPDGSSSGGTITLSANTENSTVNGSISINWITGEISDASG